MGPAKPRIGTAESPEWRNQPGATLNPLNWQMDNTGDDRRNDSMLSKQVPQRLVAWVHMKRIQTASDAMASRHEGRQSEEELFRLN